MSQQKQPVLSIRGLRKAFGTLEVLRGIDLDAFEGDVISILGASGSGKSTLLRCINLLEVPDAGDIAIGGETIALRRKPGGVSAPADRAQLDRLRSRLGFVFQSFNLWSHLTVLENVIEAPVHVQKRPRAECIAEAEALLDKVGIADKRNHYPAHLSGGQQQRAAIARALITDPALIVADEPTGDLDRATGEEILSLLDRFNRELGKTIIMVTHDPKAAAKARRLVHLEKGRIEDDAGAIGG